MEAKTKKWLMYGGAGLVGLVLYSKYRASKSEHAHDHKDTKPKAATPPAPAAQNPYLPLSLPIV